jgi:hypothetical protein
MKSRCLLVLLTALLTCKTVTAQQQQSHQNLPANERTKASFISSNSYGSFTDTALSKNFYLKKSKSQKTAGWFMLGEGVAMGIAGGILFAENFELFGNGNEGAANTGGALFIIGSTCTLGSLPLFISSARNAGKAARLSVSNQDIKLPGRSGLATKRQTGLTFNLGIR